MVNLTLSLPEELHNKMIQHPEFKWSEIARQAFRKRLKNLEMMNKILAKSELTEKDAEEIGHKIKAGIAKRLGLI